MKCGLVADAVLPYQSQAEEILRKTVEGGLLGREAGGRVPGRTPADGPMPCVKRVRSRGRGVTDSGRLRRRCWSRADLRKRRVVLERALVVAHVRSSKVLQRSHGEAMPSPRRSGALSPSATSLTAQPQ